MPSIVIPDLGKNFLRKFHASSRTPSGQEANASFGVTIEISVPA